jgi:ketosteroid isomerase-like protein
MRRVSIFVTTAASVLMLATSLPPNVAVGQDSSQRESDVEHVNAAGRAFIAAIAERDIRAIDKIWAHESHVTFIGPLSTNVVVGWDGVRKAWEMRFGQFDRVTISLAESHVRTNGDVAWAVGLERFGCFARMGTRSASMRS